MFFKDLFVFFFFFSKIDFRKKQTGQSRLGDNPETQAALGTRHRLRATTTKQKKQNTPSPPKRNKNLNPV